ncbi:unnamed protein product, partial [marine sediment metagenome]
KRLNSQMNARELSKLLPHSAGRIKRLTNLRMPRMPVKIAATDFAAPLVFFLNDKQQKVVGEALSLAQQNQDSKTKAAKKAAGLTTIAQHFLNITSQAHKEDEDKVRTT